MKNTAADKAELPTPELLEELIATLEAAGFERHGAFLRLMHDELGLHSEWMRELGALVDAQQNIIESQADTIAELRARTMGRPARQKLPG
jgi:hypothetical protein